MLEELGHCTPSEYLNTSLFASCQSVTLNFSSPNAMPQNPDVTNPTAVRIHE